jgi:hypothetical protein
MQDLIKNTKYIKFISTSGDKINLFHYSQNKFSKFNFKEFGQLRSKNDVKGWGTDRIFFYTKPSCIDLDHGVPEDYMYNCQVPLQQLYPVYENPLKLNGDVINFYKIYDEASDLGYVGFIYSFQKDGSCPIVVIWDIDSINILKIIDKSGKEHSPKDMEDEDDFKLIGTTSLPGEKIGLTSGMKFKIELYMDDYKNIIAKTELGKEIKIDQYSSLYKVIYNKFGKK